MEEEDAVRGQDSDTTATKLVPSKYALEGNVTEQATHPAQGTGGVGRRAQWNSAGKGVFSRVPWGLSFLGRLLLPEALLGDSSAHQHWRTHRLSALLLGGLWALHHQELLAPQPHPGQLPQTRGSQGPDVLCQPHLKSDEDLRACSGELMALADFNYLQNWGSLNTMAITIGKDGWAWRGGRPPKGKWPAHNATKELQRDSGRGQLPVALVFAGCSLPCSTFCMGSSPDTSFYLLP